MNEQGFLQFDDASLNPGTVTKGKSKAPAKPRPSQPARNQAGSSGTKAAASDPLFDQPGSEAGFMKWVAGRKMAAEHLARKINLPLGHEVEVWLIGGVRLKGKLHLQNEVLFIEEENLRQLPLVVDKVAFTYSEMESCLRTD